MFSQDKNSTLERKCPRTVVKGFQPYKMKYFTKQLHFPNKEMKEHQDFT